MKEMYLRLPLVEIGSDPQEVYQAKNYPKSGRYIIRRSNGDITVADVQIREVEIGEARPIDESTLNVCETFVGQPELFDPDDWVLATDMENARNAMDADRERHEAEMAEQKAKCEAMCKETEERCKALIDKKDAELQYRIDTLNEANEQKLAMRRMELEQEFEMKKLQLDLETPKRFAQGEWVSGKTLTEIIKTLADGKKED